MQKFNRFDWVEMDIASSDKDHRPESHKVFPETINIVHRAKNVSEIEKVRLWKPFISESITSLKQENKETGKTLGIIKPDPKSITFHSIPLKNDDAHEQRITKEVYRQVSLLEPNPLKPLGNPEYSFEYRFTSAGARHKMKIHDWEIAAAYYHYKRRYDSQALEMLLHEYGKNIPASNLHLIMGTMLSHPRQFIIIGLLRTTIEVETADAQLQLI
jgi:hypothetical protein